jgi:hypothetical protein
LELKKTYFGNNNPNWIIFFRGVETADQIENTHMKSSVMPQQDSSIVQNRVQERMGCYCNCHQQYDIGFARKCGTPKIGSSVSMGK